MRLRENYKEIFSGKSQNSINKALYDAKMSGVALNMLNEVFQTFMEEYGIPTKTFALEAKGEGALNPFYDTWDNNINVFYSLGHTNMQHFENLIIAGTTKMQDFIFNNGISRMNINNLSYENYVEMAQKFWGTTDLHISEKMFENFKMFIKTEFFFDANVHRLMLEDKSLVDNTRFANNNIIFAMTRIMVTKEINTTFFEPDNDISETIKSSIADANRLLRKKAKMIEPEKQNRIYLAKTILSPLSRTAQNRLIKKSGLTQKINRIETAKIVQTYCSANASFYTNELTKYNERWTKKLKNMVKSYAKEKKIKLICVGMQLDDYNVQNFNDDHELLAAVSNIERQDCIIDIANRRIYTKPDEIFDALNNAENADETVSQKEMFNENIEK